jgi:formate dehydrogenase subunit delta
VAADKLVYVANQIGKFFATQDKAKAPAEIEDHLRKFWDPRMRRQICAHLEQGGAGFDPLVRIAIESLAAKSRTPAA